VSLCHSKTGSSKKRLKCLQHQVSTPQSFQIFSTFATVDPTRPNTTHDITMLSCLMAHAVKSMTTNATICWTGRMQNVGTIRDEDVDCGEVEYAHTHTHTHNSAHGLVCYRAARDVENRQIYRIVSRSGSRPAYIDICRDDTRHCHQHTRPAHYRPGSAAPDSLKQCRTHNKCTQ